MKRVYLDTNLILSPLRMQDPSFPLMEKIKEQNHLEFVTSTLTIVEIFNIVFRDFEIFKNAIIALSEDEELKKLKHYSFDLQIRFVIEYLFQYYNITLLEDHDPELISFQNKNNKINPIFKFLLNFDFNPKLKTLDLIHYCYAKYFNEIRDLQINYLITSDISFQSARENLKVDSSFLILSPESLLDIEC